MKQIEELSWGDHSHKDGGKGNEGNEKILQESEIKSSSI